MSLTRILFLCCLLHAALGMQAQQRKNTTRQARTAVHAGSKTTTDVQHLIEVYDWAKASSALQALLNNTKDAGKLLPSAQVFPNRNNNMLWSDVTFVNPLATTAIFAATSDHTQRLHSVFRAGNGWTPATPLAGIDSLFNAPDYPFLLSDGTTLYFSAKGQESIGGYDIFVTRYNPESRQYVKPSNIGMPFNSPANEYLYAVDPTSGIGYLATDRRQAEGKVCIYSFIVPTERKDYDKESISLSELSQYAQIASIARSQVGQSATIKSVQQRKLQQKSRKQTNSISTFRFVINDDRVCRSEQDFQNKEARALVPEWFKAYQQKIELQQQCDAAELAYARQRSDRNRQMLATLQKQLIALSAREKALSQQIRQLETAQ